MGRRTPIDDEALLTAVSAGQIRFAALFGSDATLMQHEAVQIAMMQGEGGRE